MLPALCRAITRLRPVIKQRFECVADFVAFAAAKLACASCEHGRIDGVNRVAAWTAGKHLGSISLRSQLSSDQVSMR